MAITRRGPSGWVLLLARGGEGIWRERLVEVRVREWGKFGKWSVDHGKNDGGGVWVDHVHPLASLAAVQKESSYAPPVLYSLCELQQRQIDAVVGV
ncbi:hypothetical protein TRIUR3_26238 [Triticum urartu]|uniref:Uncharacterized protein n=1 Tax=Triticum urartu TaxID=4572 RepID=M7YZV8_TRIUA|nr:hypothetical protein TRIUR3_26238 [Triticum urartu]